MGRLESVSIRPPGLFGLNTQQAVAESDPRWATQFNNFVFDETNRPCSRKGWTMLTTTGNHGEDTESVFEYVVSSSTTEIISVANGVIYKGTTTLTDITGTATISNSDDVWQFLNFNGKCIGVQAGQQPIVYTSGGSFADIVESAGTAPTGGAGLSAWGRLFITDSDERTIKWCKLLDETDWSAAADAGSLDTDEVWPDGLDNVVALASWQNKLIIFGSRSVLIYNNAHQPADATDGLELDDIIVKAGCVGRDSVQAIGDDLLYMSHDGLRSLRRSIEFSTLPMVELSTNVKDDLIADISSAANATIKSTYNPKEGFYLARLGANYWMFDTKLRLEGDNLRASKWSGIGFLACHTASDNTTYLGQNDGVADYSGFLDDAATYLLTYESVHMDLDNDQLKVLKDAVLTVVTEGGYAVNFKWGTDFRGLTRSGLATLFDATTGAEWQDGINLPAIDSEHEWGTAEWSGADSLIADLRYPLSEAGHRVQVGFTVNINGSRFCVQELRLLHSLGRLAA